MADTPGARASSSANGSISVVIPARNEEGCIGRTLERLRTADVCEVVVADGASSDRTAEIARSFGATVVPCDPGRGRQLNAGARACRGEILLFLHADTLAPPGFERVVRETLGRPGVVAGAFRLRIDSPRRAFRLIEWGVAWRCRLFQMPYGDQGIFVPAETFHSAGGFPELPVMEDWGFIRRLRKNGAIAVANQSVLTSPRYWDRRGIVRTTFLNQVCILARMSGVSADRINRWRTAGMDWL